MLNAHHDAFIRKKHVNKWYGSICTQTEILNRSWYVEKPENVGHTHTKNKKIDTCTLSHNNSSADSATVGCHISSTEPDLECTPAKRLKFTVWNANPTRPRPLLGDWGKEDRQPCHLLSQTRPHDSGWLIIHTYIWRWIAKLIIDRDADSFSEPLVVSGGSYRAGLCADRDEVWGHTAGDRDHPCIIDLFIYFTHICFLFTSRR